MESGKVALKIGRTSACKDEGARKENISLNEPYKKINTRKVEWLVSRSVFLENEN